MKKILLPLVVLLAGCASAPRPTPQMGGVSPQKNSPAAKISDSAKRISAGEICFFQMTKIDGQRVRTSLDETAKGHLMPGFAVQPIIASHVVPAESSVLTLEGYDRDEFDFFGHIFGMFHVRGEVTAALEPGKDYFIRGGASEYSISVWLEDAVGHRVSDVIEQSVPPRPDPGPIEVPNPAPNFYVDYPHPNNP